MRTNDILWHFGIGTGVKSDKFAPLDFFVDNKKFAAAFVGKLYQEGSSEYVKSSLHSGSSGGKLTRGFLYAIARAADAFVSGSKSSSAIGMNSSYCCCETTIRSASKDILGTGAGLEDRVLCLYNRKSGAFTVSRKPEEVTSDVYFLAMFMALLKENAQLNSAFTNFVSDFKNVRELTAAGQNIPESLAWRMASRAVIACDAAYYMTKQISTTKAEVPYSSKVASCDASSSVFSKPEVMPDTVFGDFQLRTDFGSDDSGEAVDAEKFVGYYAFGHTLTDEEEKLVPEIPGNESPSGLTKTICQVVCNSTKKARHVRNVLLYGPTGTGKSTMARHIAAGLHLPYVSFNCNADTTIMDLLVQCLPADKDMMEKRSVEASPMKGIPSIDDMFYDPDSAWETMTGEKVENMTYEKCMSEAYFRVTGEKKDITIGEYVSFLIAHDKAKAGDNNQFMYVESPLVKAVRNGWVVEIQEPTTIVQAGVLPGLNSLLDAPGSIFLPNGEVVMRHPDCVIVATTNLNYQGCRAVNQSFLRRFQFKAIVDTPKKAQALARLKEMVGFNPSADYVSETMMNDMLLVAQQIKTRCDELDLTEGDIGICEVADWVNAANMVGSVVQSSEWSIIPSATQDPDGIKELRDIIRQKFSD